jgi:hypothetical protein
LSQPVQTRALDLIDLVFNPAIPPPFMVSFSAWVSRAGRGSLAVAQ